MGMNYVTMEKAEAQKKEQMAHLDENWNKEPYNGMAYDSHQSEETKAEIEEFHNRVMKQRQEDYAKGEVPVSQIMYPSMAKISASELQRVKAEETRQKQIEDWNRSAAMADEMHAD